MKLKKYILLGLTTLFLASCSDDFLEKQPLGVLSDATFNSDETSLDMAVNRLYGTLAWREWMIGAEYYQIEEVTADDYNPAWFNNQKYENVADDWIVTAFWDRMYANIHYANVVIDRIPNVTDAKLAAKYESQAKFFRAYYNFELTNVFGDVPLRDHDPKPSEYNIPKSSHADVVKLIISDLETAILKLPTRSEWGTAGLGRVTKGTAQGLLAKVYLYEKNYTKAKEYADAVITGGEYSLFNSYRNLFSPDNLYSSENMMPGGYIFNSSIWVGRWYNPYNQFQGCNGEFGNGDVIPSENLGAEYETGDPRFAATLFTETDKINGFISKKGAAADGSVKFPSGVKYLNKKVIWPTSYWNNGDFNFVSNNPMFLRLADVILIDAEASNELGNTADALKYLEQIRFRARGNKTYADAGVLPEVTSSDKTVLRLAIWHERRVELALEGKRWFDLIRYNNVASANGSDGTGYTENLLKNTYGRTGFNYAKHKWFPLPAKYVTSSNGILKQNPNW